MRALSLLFILLLANSGIAQTDPERLAVMIEAISRLSPEQIASNPQLKAAAGKVLEATRGTPQFVKLVQQLQMRDQNQGLLETAQKLPADEAGVTAIRLVLEHEPSLIAGALESPDKAAALLAAEVTSNASDKRAVPLLAAVAIDSKRDLGLRKQCVRGLARTQEGATELLKLAREDKIPADIRFTAATELRGVRWSEIRSAANEFFPAPQAAGSKSLPSASELLGMKGDAIRGQLVYERDDVGCINCHQVNGRGKDFGPALSEIGTKLGKDALLEAILDPSAGISFGFEAHEIKTKAGDEMVGIIVSETAEEIILKDATAVATRLRKPEITNRTQLKTSIMPAGLQAAMTPQELVDLLEYLSSLKKR